MPISRIPEQTNATDPTDPDRAQEFDPLFKAPLWIDIAHHEIHEGDMFYAEVYDEDAASGHLCQIFLLTPAVASPQKRIHMTFSFESSGEHQFTVTEDCTYSSGGAAYTAKNRLRGGGATSMQSMYSGTDKGSNTISTSGGTTMYDKWKGAGKSAGGSTRGSQEWILEPNTGYLFELASKAAGIPLDIELLWYEHTDG